MAGGHGAAIEQAAAGNHHARRRQHGLGPVLVHGQRRGQHAGVGIGNGQGLEHPLHTAVLAPHAVQGVEGDVGLQLSQDLGQVATGGDAADPRDLPLKRLGAHAAGRERHLALGRQSAHQDGDMKL